MAIFKPKDIKEFVITNKILFLISFLFIFIGLVIGVVIEIKTTDTLTIFASSTASLTDIITGDYSAGTLFFSCFKKVFLATVILFVFSLTKITSFLNYIYLAYQGMLVSATATNLIYLNGLTGALNVVLFTVPVNLINLLIIAYASSLFIKRRDYQRSYNKTFLGSFSAYSGQLAGLLIGVVLASAIYGVFYPILLRSIVVISY